MKFSRDVYVYLCGCICRKTSLATFVFLCVTFLQLVNLLWLYWRPKISKRWTLVDFLVTIYLSYFLTLLAISCVDESKSYVS